MGKNILITGANRGIGLCFVKQFLNEGYNVWGLCRKPSKELEQSDAQIVKDIDLNDPNFEKHLLEQVQGVEFNIVINNAGILKRDTLEDLKVESLTQQFLVNAVAPLRVTQCLLPQLTKGAKVAMITSRMGSIGDNTSGSRYGYRMSKAALNMASVSLAHDLKEKDIAVGIYHPGFVQTDMVNHQGDIPPEEAAKRIAGLISKLHIENSGTFWHSNGETLPW